MPPVSISRNADVALLVTQWIRDGKPVTAELQNKLASIVGYSATVSAGLIWHSPGMLSTSAGASLIPNSTSSPRRRWNLAWHSSPYASFIYVQFELALQDNGTATDPYGACIVSNEAGTAVGTAIHHGGSWAGFVSDTPAYFSGGQHRMTVPTHSGGVDFADINPDTEYTAAFWDYGYARIQSAAVWEVSLTPTTENGWASNSTPVMSPIYATDRSSLATMARNIHRRAGTPVFHWCADTNAAAPSAGLAANQGVLSSSIGSFTLSAAGTTGVAAPTFQAAGTFSTGAAVTVTVPWPTHAVDDIALLLVTSSNSVVDHPLSDAQGFTFVNGIVYDNGGGNYDTLSWYWCRATSTSMGSPVVAADPFIFKAAQIFTFRGCTTSGSPIDATDIAGWASTTSATIPGPLAAGVTTVTPLCLVVSAIAIQFPAASGNFSGWTNASLASITEQADEGYTISGAPGSSWITPRGIGLATGVKTAAGAVNNTTLTIASAASGCGLMVALKP